MKWAWERGGGGAERMKRKRTQGLSAPVACGVEQTCRVSVTPPLPVRDASPTCLMLTGPSSTASCPLCVFPQGLHLEAPATKPAPAAKK